jgi:hypothetical protein
VNVEPLSHEAAMGLLGSKLKLGAAATGKIMITGEEARETGSSRYQWGSIANQFYQKDEGTFVQKREFRMGTKSEHHEITMGKTSRKKVRLSL